MSVLRITGGRIIDPSRDLDQIGDIWISDGRIAFPEQIVGRRPDQTIDAHGLLVFPGLVDMHVHLREPGGESAETIATGVEAALHGGVTSLACMPDSEPAVDDEASASFVILQAKRAGSVHVWPVGAVTKGRNGEELAEMGGLVRGGAVAFSDSDRPIANPEIMRRALQYAQMFNRPVLSHPEVRELSREGLMNEGVVSMALGLPAMPAAAEEIMVERDLHLARWTGGRLHLQNLSCEGSIASVRRAKEKGLPVTAEVLPFHFTLTEEELRRFDSNCKVNPPLRTSEDVEAVLTGLADGTIDVIASGHSPRAAEHKQRELDVSPFGAIGLETMLPVCIKALIDRNRLTWKQLIGKLSTNPARVLGIDRGSLAPGKVADVVLFDPNETWTIAANQFKSRSRNSPFLGWNVRGRVRQVFIAGENKLFQPKGVV